MVVTYGIMSKSNFSADNLTIEQKVLCMPWPEIC